VQTRINSLFKEVNELIASRPDEGISGIRDAGFGFTSPGYKLRTVLDSIENPKPVLSNVEGSKIENQIIPLSEKLKYRSCPTTT
jgi:hypothetical protein